MNNIKYVTCIMVGSLVLSGCSTKENDFCVFGMSSEVKSYRDDANPIYIDANGKELSRQAKKEILKQAEQYALDSINEDYVLAESLCPKLNTTETIFETIHVDVDVKGKTNDFFSVPYDYTGSQVAAVQLYNNSKKSYTSRISGGLAEGNIANMVVQGPCFNNICTEKDLVEFCKTKQRTELTDKKTLDNLKTYYIREREVKINYPQKDKKTYRCKSYNWLHI